MKKPIAVSVAVSLALSSGLGALHCGGDDSASGPADAGADVSAPGPYDAVPVSETVNLTGLHGPVDVVRDRYGMVHIRTVDAVDAMRVQGYQVARDRTMQLELIRRKSEGRLAEVFGNLAPDLVADDIVMRSIGLTRVAQRMYDALPKDSESRAWLDAYADGISQFNARIASGDESLPRSMVLVPRGALAPWTAVDVLAVVRFQALNLSYDADSEIERSAFVDAARAKFNTSSVDPLAVKRAGFLNDFIRFAPLDKTTVLPGFPVPSSAMSSKKTVGARPVRTKSRGGGQAAAWSRASAFQKSIEHIKGFLGGDRSVVGSNNWVVAPSRTATGHAMLSSDPHLSLSAPSVFWMVHVQVENETHPLDFAGMAFPGIPGVILGFNRHIAWGATTAYYDVSDVYREQLTPDKTGVVFRGQNVPFVKVRETIKVAQGAPVTYDVLVVPHHGPVVPDIQKNAVVPPSGTEVLSVKWTGHEPTRDVDAIFALLRAKSVDEAGVAFRDFAVGAQNWVLADTNGDVLYTSHAQLPKRDKAAFTWNPEAFSGTIPCMVLPGDGTAEWTGQSLDEALVPHVKNPQAGFVVTANNDQVGTTLDNDPTNDKLPDGSPVYLSCVYDQGFRAGRIRQRLEGAGHPLSLDDMAAIQADARSATGAKLAPKVALAIEHALAEATSPGTHPDLTTVVQDPRFAAAKLGELRDWLVGWADHDYDAASGVNPDDNTLSTNSVEAADSRATAVFNVWLARMVTAVFGDELAAIGKSAPVSFREQLIYLMDSDPSKLKTFDAGTSDSSLFDDMTTPAVESRDNRVVVSLLDAVDYLAKRLGADRQAWRWGRIHTIHFAAPVSIWDSLSIPSQADPVFGAGFPRHGDGFNVDVAGFVLGRSLADTYFGYAHGPVQRFVIDMDPKGPTARNAIPGGNVWDNGSPHFSDEAELWRRNQNHPVLFATPEIIQSAEGRTVYRP